MSTQQAQHPLDAEGGIDLGIPVRAVLDPNHPEPVVWTYDRRQYVLTPGVPRMVPYMAMVMWQGDPRAIDLPGGRKHEQHRRQQREHLRILYGVYEHEERWAEIPEVTCYPIDSDVPFNTVLRDPEGTSLDPQAQQVSEVKMLREHLNRMAAQMQVLQSQIAMSESAEQAAAVAGMDLSELDRQATEHRAVAPEEATGESMVGPQPQRRPIPKGGTASREAGGPVTRDGE